MARASLAKNVSGNLRARNEDPMVYPRYNSNQRLASTNGAAHMHHDTSEDEQHPRARHLTAMVSRTKTFGHLHG
jgi:hypothetical protein